MLSVGHKICSVGFLALCQLALQAEAGTYILKCDHGRAKAEWHDFDRQRKLTKGIDHLGTICNDDHCMGGRCDDLLAQESSPATLDQSQLRVDLVRSVNRQVKDRGLIQCG